ncbi:hypothetical protein U1Q18_015684, partial [Sarracenia purpurea var. burkii]
MDDLAASSRSLMRNTATTVPFSFSSSSIFTNFPLNSALVAFAITQSIKFFTS